MAPEKDDSENEAVDLQKHPHLPSTNASKNTNGSTDTARSTRQPRMSGTKESYPGPREFFLRSRVGSPDSMHRWVRQLLGRGSPVRPKSPILTARPRRSSKYISLNSAGTHRASTLPFHTEASVAVDGSRSQQRDIESTSTVMKQTDPESFSKLIIDLEVLLKEVLSIARQAADTDEIVNVVGDRDKSGQDLPTFIGVDEDLQMTRLIQGDPKQDRSRITIVEPERNQHLGRFGKLRDPTPYPPSSATHTWNASLAPMTGIINSTSEHAKELTTHLRLPEPEAEETNIILGSFASSARKT